MPRTVQLIAVPASVLALALVPAVAGAGGGGGAAPVAAAAAKKPVRRTVHIGDNFYAPVKLTVPKGSTVVWKWPTDTGDSHDVTLRRGPKGVKRFQSEIASSDYSYKRRLTRAGTYRIVCSLHASMTMQIVVR